MSKFLGKENVCSTDLDLLVGNNKSRFEIFKLYKKLACILGETNFGILQSSAILKKLTGSDLIGFEVKNKAPFDDYNYAKIIIASNSLPSSEDTSDGFYRRWVIIDFPNQFKEGKDITKSIPEIEYNNLAKKCCNLLPELLERGEFTNQGSIEERKNKYIMASNPLPFFIEHFFFQNPQGYIRYSDFYLKYVKFLQKYKRRIVSKKEFSKILIEEAGDDAKPTLGVEIGGLRTAEALLLARYFMFSQVYLHHVRRIYDHHFGDFLVGLFPKKITTKVDKYLEWTDNEILLLKEHL